VRRVARTVSLGDWSASRLPPATDRLDALNKITARATQNLSRFDLDLQQLAVKGVEVNDVASGFARDGQELVITPAQGIPDGSTFKGTCATRADRRRSLARRADRVPKRVSN
jgi:hypothetical protein